MPREGGKARVSRRKGQTDGVRNAAPEPTMALGTRRGAIFARQNQGILLKFAANHKSFLKVCGSPQKSLAIPCGRGRGVGGVGGGARTACSDEVGLLGENFGIDEKVPGADLHGGDDHDGGPPLGPGDSPLGPGPESDKGP